MLPLSKLSKKGVAGVIHATIGLVLGFLFIVLMILVLSKLTGMFTGPPDEGTQAMYNRMFNAIDAMMEPGNEVTACKILTGYIEPNYAIVGFNHDSVIRREGDGDRYIEEHCGPIDDNVYKPTNCFNLACLCVCNGGTGDISGDDCDDSDATCRRVDPEILTFRTHYGSDEVDLVLYGESCWVGSDNDVMAGYVLRKTGSTITIDAVPDNDDIPSDMVQCDQMLRELSRGQEEGEENSEGSDDESSSISVAT